MSLTGTEPPAAERRELHLSDFPNGVPVSLWDQDHKSTMLYLEARVVDHGGVISEDDPRMRIDARRYPTRLSDGSVVYGHTDYDCLADAVRAGFVLRGRARLWPEDSAEGRGQVCFRLTDDGWAYAHALRRTRAHSRSTYGFVPDETLLGEHAQ